MFYYHGMSRKVPVEISYRTVPVGPTAAERMPSQSTATPRAVSEPRAVKAGSQPAATPRAVPKARAVPDGSATVMPGSNFYGRAAPFGTSMQRFSPSMSMAHHLPNHTPHVVAQTATTGRSRAKLPNRRWMPESLRDIPDEMDRETLSAHPSGSATTNKSATHGTSCDAPLPGTLAAAAAAAANAAKRGVSRPRSACEEQHRFRELRREITEMREQKLSALRGSEGASRPSSARGSMHARGTRVVGLEGLEGQSVSRIVRRVVHPPLACGAAAGVDENTEANASASRETTAISVTQASLLEFIAGEARRR